MDLRKYRMVCTLTFGDIYGQIIVWLVVLFISLAAALGLMGASRPIYALATVGLILVLSLPFLLFAFVTTLLNHIEFSSVDPATEVKPRTRSAVAPQKPAQAAS
jgi:quinol-cytochrome oxidoreductase complex cytochrome b subunit